MISRRAFLGSTSAFMAAGAAVGAEEKPLFRLGLYSDTHVNENPKSFDRVRKALALFKREGADVVAHLGDLSDLHYPKAYTLYRAIIDETFAGGKMPRFIYAYGNHDSIDPKRVAYRDRQMDRHAAFAVMKAGLKIDHKLTFTAEIGGFPFLVFPESVGDVGGLPFFEKTIAEAAAKYPGKPIFVLIHEPVLNTNYNTTRCSPAQRPILEKYPQVVFINGHKHATVKNERSIWQGGFTAIQTSCLQSWYGINVGTPPTGKPTYGVMVADVFANHMVIHRFDVRDGAEFRPEAPWTIDLPYKPSPEAPYSNAVRARSEKPGVFADGAAWKIALDHKPFNSVRVFFPTVKNVEDVLVYRLEIARQSTGGTWEIFARADVFGDFDELPANRTGNRMHAFSAGFFESGKTYRFSATPVGFFETKGKPSVFEWTAPEKALALRTWESDNPLAVCEVKGGTVDKAARTIKVARGNVTVSIPAEAWKDIADKTKYRFIVDMALEQKALEGLTVRWAPFDGKIAAGWLNSGLDDKGVRRYVIENVVRPGNKGFSLLLGVAGPTAIKLEYIGIEKL